MKKSIFTYAVSALCLAAIASCQKVELTNQEQNCAGQEESTTEFLGILPSTVSAPMSDDATKVGMTYDPANKVYNHYWEEGDEIRVYNNGATGLYRTTSAEAAASGTFTLVSEQASTAYKGTDFLAVYPENLYVNNRGISAQYYEGSTRIMVARSATSSFTFTSVLGWIKLTFKGTKKVSGLYFDTSNLYHGPLNGNFDFDLDGNVTSTDNLEEPYIGYNLSEPVELSELTDTDFYMAMIPGTYNAANRNRFMVQVMFSDGTREELYGPAEVTVTRNRVTPLAWKYIGTRPTPANESLALTANCCNIVVPYSTDDPDEVVYEFKATCKGQSTLLQDQITGGVRADVIWETKLVSNQSIAKGSVIKNVNYNSRDGRIQFTVRKGQIGNALIGLYDKDGNILWSWHIWLTYSNELKSYSTNTYEYNGHNYCIASWALGRLNINDFTDMQYKGLLYQWGRKDPFFPTFDSGARYKPYATAYPVVSDSKATVAEAIAHPTTYYRGVSDTDASNYAWNSEHRDDLWSDTEKTIYDPCPYGWRVVSSEIIADMFANSTKDSNGRVSNAANTSVDAMLVNKFAFKRFPYVDPSESSKTRGLGNGLMYDTASYYWTAGSNGTQSYAISATISTPIQYLDEDYQKTAYACPVRCMKAL